MFRPGSVFYTVTRTYIHRSTPQIWKERDGKKYGLITYFPRHKDEVDPPIKPSKVFLVERFMTLKNVPRWDKYIMKCIGLDKEYMNKKFYTLVKNTPENCALLWRVKHLVRVVPIDMPDKLPDDIDSISTYLHESGKLMVFPKIDKARYEATEKFINNPKKLDTQTMREKLRLKWLNAME